MGWNTTDGRLSMSEESRANHIHIIGTTREGKSKFLELLVRQDIDNGYGCTVIDPSDHGDTCYNILRYCASIGYDKVCIIDPHDFRTAIPIINPLHYNELVDGNVEMLMESLRMLWGSKDFADTARIQTYLSAVLTVLHRAQATIPDAMAFSVRDNPMLARMRHRILDKVSQYDESRIILDEVFGARTSLYTTEFKSSVRRLNPFFKWLPRRMYGTDFPAIDFRKMISEKWVVLVNLYRGKLWGEPQQRILGTLIIMEMVSAFMTLEETPWKGRHYLYIDEAGQYATKVLSDIMTYKGKSGFWATVSHQFYKQFDDEKVLAAVENLTKIKVAFYIPNKADRVCIAKDIFWGDMADKEAVDALGKLSKQEAFIKIGKDDARKITVEDVPTPDVSPNVLGSYKEAIYKQNPWYRTKEEIKAHFDGRFSRTEPAPGYSLRSTVTTNTGTSSSRQRKGDTGDGDAGNSQGKDNDRTVARTVLNNPASSGSVLQRPKRRTSSKRDPE